MYSISLIGGKLVINSLAIVDLNEPFHSVLRVKQPQDSIKSITEVMESSQIRKFLVKKNNFSLYKMHTTRKDGMKSQVVYKSLQKVERLFHFKCVSFLLSHLDQYPAILSEVNKIVDLICSSYEFGGVLTDIKPVGSCNLKKYINYQLVNTDGMAGDRINSLKILLNKYRSIPLRVLPANELKSVKIFNTNIDSRDFIDNNYLLIIGANSGYAGFLYETLKSFGKAALPVTLFDY